MPTTVVIGGASFKIYGSQANGIAYHRGSLGTEAAAFIAAATDSQAMALVDATRMINRHKWISTLNTFTLRDAFLVDEDPDDVPVFQHATYELAALLLADPDIKSGSTSGSNVASVGAGPAQVSFFRPTLGVSGRFPQIIKELLGEYMAGSVASADGVSNAYGTDEESSFDGDDAYGIDRSF